MPSSSLLPVGLEQFASTVKEWHYLAGGFAGGTVFGLLLALARSYVRARWVRAE